MRTVLQEALATFPQALDDTAQERMATHWQLVKQWNKRVNLTAITDDEPAAWLHYRDSLEALRVLPAGAVVDIGSGAGFPGLVIAIANPERPVTLFEPRRKRASFLRTAVGRLGLGKVMVIEGRSSDLPERTYEAAVTRATFSGWADLALCLRWVAPGGVLVAWRADELLGAPASQLHRYELRGEVRVLQVWRA